MIAVKALLALAIFAIADGKEHHDDFETNDDYVSTILAPLFVIHGNFIFQAYEDDDYIRMMGQCKRLFGDIVPTCPVCPSVSEVATNALGKIFHELRKRETPDLDYLHQRIVSAMERNVADCSSCPTTKPHLQTCVRHHPHQCGENHLKRQLRRARDTNRAKEFLIIHLSKQNMDLYNRAEANCSELSANVTKILSCINM